MNGMNVNTNEPMVSCVCPTRNRRQWLPGAIRCFLGQTYENRELVILADGEEGVADLVPDDPRIRLMVTGFDMRVVGVKRNLGCEAARGAIVAHWDDDDYSAPGRLADQVWRLATSGKAVTGYHTMKFTDGAKWWVYRGGANFALATSLCYRRDWWETHRFSAINVGQDEEFGRVAEAKKQLEAAPDLDLMFATIHDGNTSPRVVNQGTSYARMPGFQWEGLEEFWPQRNGMNANRREAAA